MEKVLPCVSIHNPDLRKAKKLVWEKLPSVRPDYVTSLDSPAERKCVLLRNFVIPVLREICKTKQREKRKRYSQSVKTSLFLFSLTHRWMIQTSTPFSVSSLSSQSTFFFCLFDNFFMRVRWRRDGKLGKVNAYRVRDWIQLFSFSFIKEAILSTRLNQVLSVNSLLFWANPKVVMTLFLSSYNQLFYSFISRYSKSHFSGGCCNFF